MVKSDSGKTLEVLGDGTQGGLLKQASCPLCGSGEARHFLSTSDRFHWRSEIYELLCCSRCSCVWLADPPAPAEMSAHYDDAYHYAITTAGETDALARWRRPRQMITKFKRGGSILDIGCSSGSFLGTMKGPDWKLYGIEMEESTAAKARQRTGAEIFVGDALTAPFPAGSFDVITCFDLLEHVYQPREFLQAARRWLKPGGILCLVLPNIAAWESRIFGSYWYGLELPRHLFHFSPKSLRYLMNSLGLNELQLLTNTTYVERSIGYLECRFSEKMGLRPTPPCDERRPGLLWKAARKGMRLAFIRPFASLASVAGAGASIEAVFAKPTD